MTSISRDGWWLKKVWYAPDFLYNYCTLLTLAAPRITRSPSKYFAVAHFRKRPEIDPPVDGYMVSRYMYMNAATGADCASIRLYAQVLLRNKS